MVSTNKEKYLLVIYTNLDEEGCTRVTSVANSLNVSVSSASKMAKKLNEENFIIFQRYGMITLTDKGKDICERLFKNRDVLVRFLKFIGVDEETVEKEVFSIETVISPLVIHQMDRFLSNYNIEEYD